MISNCDSQLIMLIKAQTILSIGRPASCKFAERSHFESESNDSDASNGTVGLETFKLKLSVADLRSRLSRQSCNRSKESFV